MGWKDLSMTLDGGAKSAAMLHLRALAFLSISLLLSRPALPQTQGVLREVWRGIPGTQLQALYTDPRFPDQPDLREIITNGFEAPTNVDDNYGQRLRAILTAPQTGYYIFWISSDDEGVLLLSTDEKPENKRQIAAVPGWTPPRVWDWYAEQQSNPIRLVAGKQYYIEALMKEGGGGDNLAVRWRLPDGTIEEPIPASRLKPFGMGPPNIVQQPQDLTVIEGQPARFRVVLQNVGTIFYQWQRNGIDIPGATNAVFEIPSASLSDNGARFRVRVWNEEGLAVSSEATLTVLPDTQPPTLISVVNQGSTIVIVTFSERVDPATATNIANYSISPDVVIYRASLGAEQTTVYLVTSQLEMSRSYVLTVSNVRDLASSPNTIAPGTQMQFVATDLTPATIGQPAYKGSLQVLVDGYRVVAAGSDFDATADEGFFAYRQRSGSFDVRVRIRRLDYTGDWAKAALMIREDLTPQARYVAAVATPSISGCFMLSRTSPGAMAEATGAFPVNYPYTWLRIRRLGNRVFAYASIDGQLWSDLGAVTLNLPTTVYLGIAVSSQSSTEPTTVEFSQLEDVASGTIGQPLWTREPIGPCTRRTGLVISEIHYHPEPRQDGRNTQFIEICNAEPVPEDISGYRLDGDLHFTFPTGTILRPGQFLIVAASPEDFNAVYGPLPVAVLGPWDGKISSNGTIQLWHRNGGLLIDIHYDSQPPWPVAPDGAGHSLVLARPSYGVGDVRAWEASTFRGGSPGYWDPIYNDGLSYLLVNEVLASPPDGGLDFIELYNSGNEPLDVSGVYVTDDINRLRYRIPDGTVLQPGQFLALDQTALGFGLSRRGETVYVISPDQSRVLQAVRFPAQEVGVSWGRFPDGSPMFGYLECPTPGSANCRFRTEDVVINEIMYSPITGEDDDEYIELYNKGRQTIDLSGWRFDRGISFTFPEGTTLGPNCYIVVAKNRQRLLSKYPHLSEAEVLGNYNGRLNNDSELIRLVRPLDPNNPADGFVVVDEVTYYDGGRWGRWANRGGSSLELIDPHSDNRLADNWADSDETGKSEWVLIEHTGVLDNGRGAANELHILLLGPGQCLLDNVEVIPQGRGNVVPNGTFENGLQGWIIQGNHIESRLSNQAYEGAYCLQLIASGGGDNGANRIKVKLTEQLQPGTVVTIRARARWLAGHTNLLLRLKGNWLEAVGHLPVPPDLGTPGRPNSRLVANAGPAIWEVSQFPVLPRAGLDPVTVTARVDDPDGVKSVNLMYRIDPSSTVRLAVMKDDGLWPDLRAGDGVFTAQLPAQASGTIIAYWIEAEDNLGARTTFPNPTTDGEALIRWGEPIAFGNFGTYRMWFTQATIDEWSRRPQLSNHGLPGTFVYGQYRVIHNIKARYRGSPWIRPGYNSPVGNLCAYVFEVPADQPLFGAREFNLDWLEQPGRDPTFQCEHTSFWIAEQLGLPFSHQSYIYLYVNGLRRGQVYTDTLHVPSGDYIPCWFATQSDGELYKIDDWFEFDDNLNKEFNVDATLQLFTTTGGEKKQARYRWNWEKKANRGLDDDYTSLFVLVDAVNLQGEAYTRAVQNIADIDEWMRIFALRHIVCDWDGYGYNRGKNMFMYLPRGDRFKMLLWDLDFSLGYGSDGPTASIYSVNDPTVARMYNHPPFRRAYLQAIYDAVNGPLLPEKMNPLLDALYAEFVKNRVQAQAPSGIKSWVSQRRSYLINVLNQEASATFRITTNNGADFTTDNAVAQLQGTAPLSVFRITVNGKDYPTSWTTVTSWQIVVPLNPGPNVLQLQGWSRNGDAIAEAAAQIKITYTGSGADPHANLVINEIHYHPPVAGAEFVEIANISPTHAFDLSRYRIEGIGFEFPVGSLIGPGQYIVVVNDRVRFGSSFNIGLPIAGVYKGTLRHDGELLQLVAPPVGDGPEVIIDQVRYSNRPPWPTEADGLGPSLQLIDPTRPNESPANWAAVKPMQQAPKEVVLVPITAKWKYNQTDAYNDQSWTLPEFDDRSWAEGQALLYVENADLPAPKNTPLQLGRITYYFRTQFENPLSDQSAVRLYLSAVIDDGVVIYLNGRELFRLGMPDGPVGYETFANRTVGDATYEGPFELPSDLLRPGLNVIAAEVHQVTPTSSDIVFGIELKAKTGSQRLATPGEPNSVRATLPAFPPVWLNELVVSNATGRLDNYGEGDPWVELYNAGPEPILLSGLYLSDTYDNLEKWAFPTNIILPANGYILVWLDAQPEQTTGSILHANFRPNAGGGTIFLSWRVNSLVKVLDYLDYPALSADRAYGRYPDGEPFGETIMVQPTPAGPNTLASPPLAVFINEWMAANRSSIQNPADGTYSDWFELYNAGSTPVNLAGYKLTDNPNDRNQFIIPEGFIIPAKGFLVVWADGHPEYTAPDKGLHVNFKLNNAGDRIILLAPDGTIVHQVEFGPQTADISEGLYPDGSSQVMALIPTPGLPNRPMQTAMIPKINPSLCGFDESGAFHITWSSTPGRRYRVEYTDQLPAESWHSLGEYIANEELTTAVDTTLPPAGKRFYRVIMME